MRIIVQRLYGCDDIASLYAYAPQQAVYIFRMGYIGSTDNMTYVVDKNSIQRTSEGFRAWFTNHFSSQMNKENKKPSCRKKFCSYLNALLAEVLFWSISNIPLLMEEEPLSIIIKHHIIIGRM